MGGIVLVVSALLFFFLIPVPSKASSEMIRDYNTHITVNTDGTIHVAEKIIYDFGSLQRHGIQRYIPFVKVNKDGKRFSMDISDITVSDENGDSYTTAVHTNGDNKIIKIGDAGVLITGIHTYNIQYTVSGAITYFTDHDELNWNALGTDWQIPIERATAIINLPKSIATNQISSACYTGIRGSVVTNCTMKNTGPAEVTFTGTKTFAAYEGMTVVVGFPTHVIADLEPVPNIPFEETVQGKIFGIGLLLLLIMWYILLPVLVPILWFLHGRDPKSIVGTVSAWYDPPQNDSGRKFLPGEVGALVDESVDMKDISGTIVHFAQRGLLKIEERKKNDFYIKKQKNGDTTTLLVYERALYDGIFADGDEVAIKDFQGYKVVADVQKKLYAQLVADGLFPSDPHRIRNTWTFIGVFALITCNIPLAINAYIFGRNLIRKTQKGADAAAVAHSLKNFLQSQERQLNFQGQYQMLFEKLLPYAVVFGVEKQWANRFKEMNIMQPDWYQSYQTNTAINLIWLSSFNHSLQSFAQSATPPSSSSGFSSGLSGGGFSGGGGGGGGGGSW